jgi:hypothetical protein
LSLYTLKATLPKRFSPVFLALDLKYARAIHTTLLLILCIGEGIPHSGHLNFLHFPQFLQFGSISCKSSRSAFTPEEVLAHRHRGHRIMKFFGTPELSASGVYSGFGSAGSRSSDIQLSSG